MRIFLIGLVFVFMTFLMGGPSLNAVAQSTAAPAQGTKIFNGYVPPNPTPGPYRYQDYQPYYPQYQNYPPQNHPHQGYYVPPAQYQMPYTFYNPYGNYQYGWVQQHVPRPPVYVPPTPRLGANTGEMCGGIAAITCANPQDVCYIDPAVSSRIFDASGACRPGWITSPPAPRPPVSRPPVSRPPVEWPSFPPTNPNQPQTPRGEMCGGMMGATCSNPSDYCHMGISAQCGAADQGGVCRPKPQMCTREYAPVCGCDSRTYATQCVANSNGVSAAYSGRCRNDYSK